MSNIINAIKQAIHNRSLRLREALAHNLEEVRIIIRNKRYSSQYPVLFAAFSIIEHGQSTHIFDVNAQDFKTIKDKIFLEDNITSGHILESLRELFQNHKIISRKNLVKIKIAEYFFTKAYNLVNSNDSYYEPLTKAVLRGFPFLLNYNNYEIFRKLISKKSKASLVLIKYILNRQKFPEFLIKEKDAISLIISSLKFDNKPAFMLLVRYLRQNNLLYLLFDLSDHSIKEKVLNLDFTQRKGLEYGAIILSYLEDGMLKSKKINDNLTQFLEDIFSHQLGLNHAHRIQNYHQLMLFIEMNKTLGFQNYKIEIIIENIVNRFVDNYAANLKRRGNYLKMHADKAKKSPSSSVRVNNFFTLSSKYVEEYWLLKNSHYLL